MCGMCPAGRHHLYPCVSAQECVGFSVGEGPLKTKPFQNLRHGLLMTEPRLHG